MSANALLQMCMYNYSVFMQSLRSGRVDRASVYL